MEFIAEQFAREGILDGWRAGIVLSTNEYIILWVLVFLVVACLGAIAYKHYILALKTKQEIGRNTY